MVRIYFHVILRYNIFLSFNYCSFSQNCLLIYRLFTSYFGSWFKYYIQKQQNNYEFTYWSSRYYFWTKKKRNRSYESSYSNSKRVSGDGSKVGTNGSDGSTATFVNTGNASYPWLLKDGSSSDNGSQYTTAINSKRVCGDGSKVCMNGSDDGSTVTCIDTGNESYPSLIKDGSSSNNGSQYTKPNISKRVSGDSSKVRTNGSDGTTVRFVNTGNDVPYPSMLKYGSSSDNGS